MVAALCLWLWVFSAPQQPAVNPHLKQGLLALDHGDLAQAQNELEQAAREAPGNVLVDVSLAQTYLRLGELDKAETAAAKAAHADTKSPVIAHALAIFAFEEAQVLLHRQEFTHAAEVLTAALRRDPQNARLELALGVARYGQRRFEDAIGAFLLVIRLDPALDQPYIFLGKMLDQAGPHLKEIAGDDRAWMARDPNEARPPLELAKVLLAGDSQNGEAQALLERSIQLDPNSWEAHYELGVLLAQKHDYSQAAAELQRSIDLNAREPMPHYHLARVYDRLGQPERAQAERAAHAALTGVKQ